MNAGELVGKATAAMVKEARSRVKRAGGAAKQLEEDVRWLVTHLAWLLLGYENLATMWEGENGFKCPTFVFAIGVDTFRLEGMAKPDMPNSGITSATVARYLGLPVDGDRVSTTVCKMRKQLEHGVPPEKVVRGSSTSMARAIEKHGTVPLHPPRSRSQPRRMGALPDELVSVSFMLPRKQADRITEIARQLDEPSSEVYRKAVYLFLAQSRGASAA